MRLLLRPGLEASVLEVRSSLSEAATPSQSCKHDGTQSSKGKLIELTGSILQGLRERMVTRDWFLTGSPRAAMTLLREIPRHRSSREKGEWSHSFKSLACLPRRSLSLLLPVCRTGFRTLEVVMRCWRCSEHGQVTADLLWKARSRVQPSVSQQDRPCHHHRLQSHSTAEERREYEQLAARLCGWRSAGGSCLLERH